MSCSLPMACCVSTTSHLYLFERLLHFFYVQSETQWHKSRNINYLLQLYCFFCDGQDFCQVSEIIEHLLVVMVCAMELVPGKNLAVKTKINFIVVLWTYSLKGMQGGLIWKVLVCEATGSRFKFNVASDFLLLSTSWKSCLTSHDFKGSERWAGPVIISRDEQDQS